MIAVKFSTSVCPQCSQQTELLKKQPLSIVLKEVVLDKDENGDSLMDVLDLMSVPTIIIFNEFDTTFTKEQLKQNELKRFKGLTMAAKINAWIGEQHKSEL